MKSLRKGWHCELLWITQDFISPPTFSPYFQAEVGNVSWPYNRPCCVDFMQFYSLHCPDRPWGPPSLLTMCTGSFPGVNRPGRGVEHPITSSAEFKERVELYLFSPSGPSWSVLGVNFTCTFTHWFVSTFLIACNLLVSFNYF